MRTLLSFLALLLTVSFAHAGKISKDCTYKGIPLHGTVYIEKSGGADFEIYVEKSGTADLSVYKTTSTASSCGEWKFTNHPGWADFSIKFTDHPGWRGLH